MMQLLLISALFVAQVTAAPQGTGTVTGRLILADGSPAAGVRVSTMAAPDSGRPATEVPALSNLTETDNSGRFRLENIKPGRYYIVAGLLDYPTYYPGTSVVGDARIVNVTAGSTTPNIDFQAVRSSTGFTVSGHVRREGGSPYGNATQVTLTSMMSGENQMDFVGLDGTFQFQKVRPGNYRLSVSPGTGVRNQNILIRDKDVSGLELVIPWSTEVHGQVVLDGKNSGNPPVVSISFAGNSVENDSSDPSQFGANLAEGNYSVVVSNIPSGFFLKSVTAGTVDLLTSPFRIPKSTTPPEIIVTLGVSTPAPWVKLGGRLTGTLPSGFGQSSGLTLYSNASSNTFSTAVAADGSFQFPALLPGMYSVSFPFPVTMPPISIMVPNRDITGIEIPVPSVKSISGRIEVPAGGPLARVSLNVTGIRSPLPARTGPPTFADLLVSVESWAANSGSQNFVVNPQADGTFKVNLPAGDYQIAASLLSNGTFNGDAYVIKSFTYGSTDLLHEPVNLTDAISSEMKLTLEPIPGRSWFKVSGRVTGMDQTWISSRPSVALYSPVFVPLITAPVNPDGTFEFPRVYSGSYSARLTAAGLPSAPPKEITVTDKNVTNLEFTVVPQREVRGKVLVEGATPAPKLTVPLVSASNRANSRNTSFGPYSEMQSLSIAPKPDGSFTVKIPAGTHQLGAIGGLPDGAMVKSFTYGAVDLMRNSLQVDATSDPAELVLTLSYPKLKPVRAAGRILGLDTAARTSNPIRVMLSDPSYAREQIVTAGADGSFEFPEVVPGLYRATVTGIDSMKGLVTSFVVPDTGVDNLAIRVPIRKNIRGRIQVEGDAPIPLAKLTLRSTTPDSTETNVDVESNTDGTFQVTLLEGSTLVGVVLPRGYELIAATYGGASLFRPPLSISGTVDSDLQIRVKAPGNLSAVRVSGTVEGLRAAALATDGMRVSLTSSIYAHPGSAIVKSDGSFELTSAFSGRYILRLSGPGVPGKICIPVYVRDSDVVNLHMAAAPATTGSDLQIISAFFGASGGSADVTPIVTRLTSRDLNEFYANPSWLEVDPAIGETKDLVIFYQHQCEERVFSVSESIAVSHAILAAHADSLDGITNSATQATTLNPANGNEVTIVNAYYGLGARFDSVTARLKQLLGPGTKPVTVNDATFDAGGNGSKILIVTYLYKGDRISFFAYQGSSVSYSSLVANAESYKRSGAGSSALPGWFDDSQPDPPREPGDRGPGAGPDPRKELGIHLLLKAIAELQAIPDSEHPIGGIDVEKAIVAMRQSITSVQNNISFRYPPASDKPVVPYLRIATRSIRMANALKFVDKAIGMLNSANPGANAAALSNSIAQARQALAYLQSSDFGK